MKFPKHVFQLWSLVLAFNMLPVAGVLLLKADAQQPPVASVGGPTSGGIGSGNGITGYTVPSFTAPAFTNPAYTTPQFTNPVFSGVGGNSSGGSTGSSGNSVSGSPSSPGSSGTSVGGNTNILNLGVKPPEKVELRQGVSSKSPHFFREMVLPSSPINRP